jgi:segregation and condensation protein A
VSPAAVQAPTTAGTTVENVEVINHLLFHKAIADHGEDTGRFNDYLALLHEGEHIAIKDPFDRSIALAFDLVVQAKLNPWDIDLVKFSTLYLENARERKIDLVTAGRIILLAWTVLKLQSEDLLRRTQEHKEEAENLNWEDIPDWGLSGPELDFTQRVRLAPHAPLDERVWHEGDRKVTLMELVDAFETARQEAASRALFVAEREAFKAKLKAEGEDRFRNRVHREDLEEDLKLVWDRILGRNGHAIPLKELYASTDIWDFVTTFNSVLFLRRDLRIELWQDNFPYGPIYVKNREAEAKAESKATQGETP